MVDDPSKDIVGKKSNRLRGKRIALCVTGSAAVMNSVELARELMRHGGDVFTIMTPAAQRLVHPNLLEWATGNPVVTELTGKMEHIRIAGDWEGKVDLILIAPCTANTISKIASGIDDTPVTTVVSCGIGSGIPIIIAPAMHESMYRNPVVRSNIERLKQLGVKFVEPLIEEKRAKMASVEEIVKAVLDQLCEKDMEGLRVLVTAGPTREYIDPVRVITNRSSGRMGIALTEEALRRGAQVSLIYGPGTVTPPRNVKLKRVESTQDLLDAVISELKTSKYELFIAAAAPSDFTVRERFENKLETRSIESLKIELKTTPKVINVVKKIQPDIFLVAFKAEYKIDEKELIERGRRLLNEAQADMVVVNDVGRPGVGFGEEDNEVYIIKKEGEVIHLPRASKFEIAKRILDTAIEEFKKRV
ncbi:MAG: bifunctional phosphopantothenoylcysteine decarboxylase/phosphopantothenate--cysteine ligase CoaBC [Nitrososphaerales archaeon]|nr:bifunctional phosphopantothenoylcysteine decarboxylase/phosphopantothenate--cysteine ligase CoaBC [Nitrososphaerales archaeon]